MHIKLHNFRSHIDSEYTILNNNITLVKGPSGSGKSTIFQGLAWCLYGGMQHIYNNSNPQKCYVQVTINEEFNIYRQKKPELFRVTYKGIIYEDDVAQGIIDNFFGTKEVWFACCYVPQSGRNNLLTASNIEKMALIHQLSFSTENPEVYIQKIENELVEKQRQFANWQDVYKRDCSELSVAISNCPQNGNLYLQPNDSERDKIPIYIEELKKKTIELKDVETQQNYFKGQIELLTQNLTQLILPFPEDQWEIRKNQSETYTNELNKLREQISKAQIYKQLLEVRRNHQNIKSRLDTKYNDVHIIFDEFDLMRFGELQARRDGYTLKAKKYNLEYDAHAIEEKIIELKECNKKLDIKYSDKDLITFNALHIQKEKEQQITKNFNLEYNKLIIENAIQNAREQISNLTYKEEDLPRIGALLEQQKRSKIIMDTYGLEYTKGALEKGFSNVEYYLEANKLRKIVTIISELQSQLAQYGPKKDPITLEDLRALDEKITQAQISSNILRCPHCKHGVRYLDGKLQSSNTEPISPRIIESLLKEQNMLSEAYKNQELRRDLETKINEQYLLLQKEYISATPILSLRKHASLEDFLSKLATIPLITEQVLIELKSVIIIDDIPSLTDVHSQIETRRKLQAMIQELSSLEIIANDIPTLDEIRASIRDKQLFDNNANIIEDLDSIEILGELPSLDLIQRSIEKNKLINEQKRLEQEEERLMNIIGTDCPSLEEIQKNITEKELLYAQLNRDLEKFTNIMRQQIEYKKQLKDLQLKIDDTHIQMIKEVEIKLEKYKEQLYIIDKYDELIRKRNCLEKLQIDINNLYKEITILTTLRETAISVEASSLQSTVDSINNVIDDIAPLLFDDPITIRISLFKTLKTKEKTKPQVNLMILYRGGEYDNINQLSGGEGDRVSLVITLALSRLCNFPLLLFDESLSSLDAQLKEAAIRAIRNATNKAVACIMHDSTEGYFDSIITIDK